MKSLETMRLGSLTGVKPAAVKVLAVSVMALTLVGCRALEDPGGVQSWTLLDPAQRHPIIVKQTPSRIELDVPSGSDGLSTHQRADVADFLARFRATGMGNSKLVIAVPSGTPNDVAAMHGVTEVREMIGEYGFADDIVSVEAYHDDDDHEPPIRLSYLRYVAEGPDCGDWSENLAHNPRNLHYPNLGCAVQRNIAAMVANPADLLGPRSMTPRDSTRRDVVFGKYYKGESTISQKKRDERVKVKGK